MNAGEWMFRHAGGCIIDTPELTTTEACFEIPYRWVATLWPDRQRPDDAARVLVDEIRLVRLAPPTDLEQRVDR